MSKWVVTYTAKGKKVSKEYANMRTATLAVERLAQQGIIANYHPA